MTIPVFVYHPIVVRASARVGKRVDGWVCFQDLERALGQSITPTSDGQRPLCGDGVKAGKGLSHLLGLSCLGPLTKGDDV